MIWLVFLFVVAAIPWFVPVMMHLRLITAAFGILILGTIFGPAFFSVPGPIQFSLDRIAWAGVLFLLFWRLLRGEVTMDRLHRLDVVVFGLAAWTFASCMRFGMFNAEQPPVARWLFYIAMPSALYFVMRTRMTGDAGDRQRLIDRLVTMLVILGTYLSFTSVFEMLDLRALIFPRYISDPTVWEFYGRGRGPLLNPAGNGIVMTLGLSACVARFFSSGRHGKLIYGLLGLIALAGCYATLTRSVWMGAVLCLAFLGTLYTPVKVRVVALAVTVAFAGAMTMGLKEQLLSFKRDKALSAADAAKSVELRPLLATVAWEMFCDRPVAGHGYGQYLKASKPYHAIRKHGLPLENVRPYVQHNVFLSLLVDLGLVGLSLHGLMVFSFACIAWQMARAHRDGSAERQTGMLMIGLLSGYVFNGMFHDVSVIAMVHTFLYVLGGLTVTVWARSALEGAAGERQWGCCDVADGVDDFVPVSPALASSAGR